MELKLEVGKEYVVTHKRKGVFRATLIEIVPSRPGDECDDRYLTFEIPTGPGSGQERIARAKDADSGVTAELTVTNIRPSLVQHLVLSTRSPELPEVERPKPPKKKSFADTFLNRFRR